MTKISTRIQPHLNVAIKNIATEIKDSLKGQGHFNTGKLYDSIKDFVKSGANTVLGIVLFNDYYKYLEYGVKANRIPFGGRSTGRKRSRYIQALIAYWQSKGKTLKEAKGAAFATAHKQKIEGMPSKGSKIYSSTGKRLAFIGESIKVTNQVKNLNTNILNEVFNESNTMLDNFQDGLKT